MLLKVVETFQGIWRFCQFFLKYQMDSTDYLGCADNNLGTVVSHQKILQFINCERQVLLPCTDGLISVYVH